MLIVPHVVLFVFIFLSLETPKVSTPAFQRLLKKGRPFDLKLDSEGVPSPVFQWFKNGYPMTGENSNKLSFAAVSSEDAGTYSCRVSNIAGSVMWLEGLVEVID